MVNRHSLHQYGRHRLGIRRIFQKMVSPQRFALLLGGVERPHHLRNDDYRAVVVARTHHLCYRRCAMHLEPLLHRRHARGRPLSAGQHQLYAKYAALQSANGYSSGADVFRARHHDTQLCAGFVQLRTSGQRRTRIRNKRDYQHHAPLGSRECRCIQTHHRTPPSERRRNARCGLHDSRPRRKSVLPTPLCGVWAAGYYQRKRARHYGR